MLKFLMVCNEKSLSGIYDHLKNYSDIEVSWSHSASDALELIKDVPFDLVIIDKQIDDIDGIDFCKKIVSVNPMVNCSIAGSLPKKEFHEKTEGLGVMGQLKDETAKDDLEKIIKTLKKIIDQTKNLIKK